ncbi:MAG: AraC family transcriptional regulator [Bacteroidales bacterium]|nr:AraC family transcriptional regulator [Candidatus Cryptobacteroides onthequi]
MEILYLCTMLISILYLLPCLVSLLWLLSFLFRVKTQRQTLFMFILVMYVFYYATYAVYISPTTDYHTMVVMDALNIPVILMLLAFIVLYMYFNDRNSAKFEGLQLVLLVPAIVLGTIVNMLYYILGFDNTAKLIELADKGLPVPAEYTTDIYRMYNFFTEPMVDVCSGIFILGIFFLGTKIIRKGNYQVGDMMRFFFKGKAVPPQKILAALMLLSFIILIPILLMGRRYIFLHEAMGVFMSICIAVVMHCLSHVEFYASHLKQVTLYELSHIKLGQAADGEDTASGEGDSAAADQTGKGMTSRQAEAAQKLNDLLEKNRIYTDENLTSSIVAEMLGISRSSLSSLVTGTYGIPFRELLNSYRIEHAKRFMCENPSATQEIIAAECGFKNAQYLNHKFREMVGETPAMWLAKNK